MVKKTDVKTTKKKEVSKDNTGTVEQIAIVKPKFKIVNLPIIGLTDFISHRLSLKTVQKITDKEIGKSSKKTLRSFDDEYESCFHRIPGKKNDFGYPASAFKLGMLFVAPDLGINKTTIKRNIQIMGNLIPIKCKKIERRIDITRRSGMTRAPNETHRPYFIDWSCELPIRYNSDMFSLESIVNLINYAGMGAGIGDWRPEKGGTNGQYEAKLTNQVK